MLAAARDLIDFARHRSHLLLEACGGHHSVACTVRFA
jgi:hypothetical protein